jgi:hypothetical protein
VGYYPNLREYVRTLESREKLFRIQREVWRETELHPLVRWQFRGLPAFIRQRSRAIPSMAPSRAYSRQKS